MTKSDITAGGKKLGIQKCMSFVKTVETGSFSKAARIMNYSQSGISRMIADLEKDWGLTLLERGKSGVSLTSDGLKMLPYAKELVLDYEKLQMQAEELAGIHTGIIRIGTFSSVATHRLPKIIKKFENDYPNIEFELLLGDYSEIREWIANGRVDCGFLALPVPDELETVFLERDKLLAVLPEDHRLAKLDKIPVEELCREPFMLLEKGGKAEISEIFKSRGLTPNVRFTTWDDYAIMSMVENGLGVSILPQLILNRIPYHIVAKELDVSAYRKICFSFKKEKTASAAVKKFAEYLRISEK